MARARQQTLSWFALVLLLLVSPVASAGLVEFTFGGTLQAVSGAEPLFDSVQVGDAFSVSLVFDESTPDLCTAVSCPLGIPVAGPNGPANVGRYALLQMRVVVDAVSYSWVDTGGKILVLNDALDPPPVQGFAPPPAVTGRDQFVAYSDPWGDAFNLRVGRIHAYLNLIDESRTAFGSDAIPPGIDLQRSPAWAFPNFSLEVENEERTMGIWTGGGAMTSFSRNTVPEPTAAVGVALVAFALLLRAAR